MKTRPYRILHVVPVLGRDRTVGGAVRAVVDIVRSQEESPHFEPRLCVLGPEDANYAHYGLSERPVFLGFPGQMRDMREALPCLRALRALIHDFRPDILHSHLWIADVLGAVAVLGREVRHVVHIHDTRPWLVDESPPRRMRRVLTRWLLRSSRATFIACSEAARQYTAENLPVSPETITVIPYGLDPSWFSPAPAAPRRDPGAFIIGAAGRLQPEKGHEFLLRAVGQLVRRDIACELRIAGGGTRMAELQELCRLLGIEAQVRFLGRVSDMRTFYEGLDVFALPSIAAEGLPISILEAMALGKAIVASDTAGVPEEITDQVNGLLVPPGDVAALAHALERLGRDAGFRGQLGRQATERARDFPLTRMATSVEQYYRDILAQPRKAWPPAPRRTKRPVMDDVPLLRPADSRPQVLHVVQGLGRDGTVGGSSRVALMLTRFMPTNAPCSAELCALSGMDPYWSVYGLAHRPHFLHLPKVEANPFRLITSVRRLRRLILACNPKLVHSHTWPVALIAGFAIKRLPVRHVVHIHDMRPWLASTRWRHRLRRCLHRWALHSPGTSFVACGEASGAYSRRHLLAPGTPVTTVLSGIDVSQFKPLSNNRDAAGPVVLGMAGSFQALKGHRYLLEALASVRRQGLDVRLMLAGYGAEEKVMRQLAEHFQLGAQATFMGLVKDMPGFMSALDIFVLPSLSEGLPLSILEAMASSLPIIATRVGEVATAVREGEEGLLVPPADAPALAAAIERMARDPELRRAMGQRGQARVKEHFRIEHMIEHMTQYYRTL